MTAWFLLDFCLTCPDVRNIFIKLQVSRILDSDLKFVNLLAFQGRHRLMNRFSLTLSTGHCTRLWEFTRSQARLDLQVSRLLLLDLTYHLRMLRHFMKIFQLEFTLKFSEAFLKIENRHLSLKLKAKWTGSNCLREREGERPLPLVSSTKNCF